MPLSEPPGQPSVDAAPRLRYDAADFFGGIGQLAEWQTQGT
jgi:hypothetical protein